MKKSSLLALLLCTACCSVHSQTIPADPQLRTGTLPNGMKYFIRHNTNPKERAHFYLVQKVGSVLEEDNQRGLAHFLEHMAFNGSKNFPGNSMITELEKKGIKFGANINASTGYDETVYKLTNIPLSREGIVDTALLVLHDWSGFLSLNDKDIDEERGVVREEWRLATSGYSRVMDNVIFPTIFKGTAYADRLPIGKIDIINNFKYQELRDYYKKWYRPDLQGLIVVGDIDVDKVEAKIKALFSDIPVPVNPAPRNYDKLPEIKEPLIITATDKEIQGMSVGVLWRLPQTTPQEKSTIEWYRKERVKQVVAALLNKRFLIIREEADPPFSYVALYPVHSFSLSPWYSALDMSVHLSNRTEALKSLKRSLTEVERMNRFGFSQAELDEAKMTALYGIEKAYNEKDEKTNPEFISDYRKLFVQNIPSPGAEWEYETDKKILSEMTLAEINAYAKGIGGTENMVITITGQEKDSSLIPSKNEILKTLANVRKEKLKQYQFKPVSYQLLAKKPAAGKIVNSEPAKWGFTKWTLSNGAAVYFKKTKYEEDAFSLRGYSEGGYSTVSDEDLPSALWANSVRHGGFGNFSYSELERAITGKRLHVNTDMHQFYENIEASSALQDVEAMFQMLWLKMTSPRKDDNFFDSWRKSSRKNFRNQGVVPYRVFKDSVSNIMSNYNPRNISLTKDSMASEKIDYDKALRIYKERFGDASQFSFFLAGNISEDSVRRYVETYLGSLPSQYKKEKAAEHNIYPPTGTVKKAFSQEMMTPSSNVFIAYTGKNIPATLENNILMSYLQSVLTRVYTKRMREDEGGVYYTGVSAWIDRLPQPNFNFRIEYTTEPDAEKKAKLESIVYEEIDRIMNEAPDAEAVEKTRLNLVKTMEEWESKQNANYWNYAAYEFYSFGHNRQEDYFKTVNSITPQQISDFAKKLFTQGNIIKLEMNPKK